MQRNAGRAEARPYTRTVNALDRAPVWRCVAKNGLRSPDVPAVEEFKKAVDAAVKQQQSKQSKP